MSEQIQADIKFNTEDQNELVDPHPWMSHHSQSIFNPIVRFHNEVIDFANYVEPSLEEHQTKLTLLSTFEN
jgi:non-canonical poly(A) RNA polymerase PAPD5/7